MTAFCQHDAKSVHETTNGNAGITYMVTQPKLTYIDMCFCSPDIFKLGRLQSAPSVTLEQWAACNFETEVE